MSTSKLLATCSLSALLAFASTGLAAEELKGWDRTARVAEYLEPAIPHAAQQQAALDKLRQLKTKTGRDRNTLIILVDDMGYGDPGSYGGGMMTGAPTPNIDRLAADGLKLTSAYATPLCTPTRAAMMTGGDPR